MNKIKKYLNKFLRSVQLIYKNFLADQGFLKASNLGYITFLGFIPFVMVIFLFTPDITMIKIRETIFDFLFKTFLPDSAEILKYKFSELLTQRFGLNIVGFILLVGTSFFLFKSISGAFDDILRTRDQRSHTIIGDFERFVSAIVGGVLVVAVLLFTSSLPIINIVTNLAFFVRLIPYLSIFLLLFIMYKFVPSVRPRAIYAVIGALVTSIFWIFLKICFDWYISTFTNIQSVYGTLSAFPIFLIWLYLNWVTIIFGMEVVSFYSGVKHPKYRKKIDKEEVRIRLRMEKTLNRRALKKIKEINISNDKEDKSELKKLIDFIIDDKDGKK